MEHSVNELPAGVAEASVSPVVANHQQVGDLNVTHQGIEEGFIVPHGTD